MSTFSFVTRFLTLGMQFTTDFFRAPPADVCDARGGANGSFACRLTMVVGSDFLKQAGSAKKTKLS